MFVRDHCVSTIVNFGGKSGKWKNDLDFEFINENGSMNRISKSYQQQENANNASCQSTVISGVNG